MATNAHSTIGAWIEHNGSGCPLPKGTLIDVRHFNGEVSQGLTVGAILLGNDGTPIPSCGKRFSGWDHGDGGPMAPKFRAYRRSVDARNAALFADWLTVKVDVSEEVEHVDAEEIEDIAEARKHVTELVAERDSCPHGSRERAVKNIILQWWAKELSSLTGGAYVPDAEALAA